MRKINSRGSKVGGAGWEKMLEEESGEGGILRYLYLYDDSAI